MSVRYYSFESDCFEYNLCCQRRAKSPEINPIELCAIDAQNIEKDHDSKFIVSIEMRILNRLDYDIVNFQYMCVVHLTLAMTRSQVHVKVHSLKMEGYSLKKDQPVEITMSCGACRNKLGRVFRFSNRDKINRHWSFVYNPRAPGYLRFCVSRFHPVGEEPPYAAAKLNLAGFESNRPATFQVCLSRPDDPQQISARLTIHLLN